MHTTTRIYVNKCIYMYVCMYIPHGFPENACKPVLKSVNKHHAPNEYCCAIFIVLWFNYIYIYIYIYVYMYMRICISVYVCVFTIPCTYIHTYACTCS